MLKLLIIDDESIIREGLRSIIPWANYGYKVCDVGIDGPDGLNKVRSHRPDLVLLDIQMPGFSGIELIQQVKNEKFACKFIILTAYSNFSYAKELMALGIESYLLKPIDEDELIVTLNKMAIDRAEEQKRQDQLDLFDRMNKDISFRALLDGNLEYVSENGMKDLHGEKFRDTQISSKGNIIDEVKNYVNNYYHEDISLKLIADLFHYNSAYLGKVFKKQTGEFFNTYLHQVRINNAKKLLENKRYKIYEISELVGYSNSDYFYKNFRLYEGISPKEFQMQNNLKQLEG